MNKQQRDYFPIWINHHSIHLAMIKHSLPYWMLMSTEAESSSGGIRPMGIVFDLDEVLISPFPNQDPSFAQFFKPVPVGFCPAYEGARDLVKKCHEMGLMVFFVTARTDAMRAATVANIDLLDMAPDLLFTMQAGQDPTQFKTNTRKDISNKFRIIASIGDQLSDLGNYTDVNYLIPNPFYRSGNY